MSQYPFVKLPKDVLNDSALSCEARVAWAIMYDCARDGVCKISMSRLAQRLGGERRRGARAVQALIAAGYVIRLAVKFGRASTFLLAHETGAQISRTDTAEGIGGNTTCTTGGIASLETHGFNPEPVPPAAQTYTVDGTGPIPPVAHILDGSSLDLEFKNGPGSEKRTGNVPARVAELLRLCGRNGNAQTEAERLVASFPGLAAKLVGHLEYALSDPAIVDKVRYAKQQTQYGADPGKPLEATT